MSDDNQTIIRGVLIQVADARLLLPNATIAEVLSYAEPDAVAGAPDWLLGRIRWRGWQLPLVAFSRFAGIAEDQGGLGSKVIVLKALGGDQKHPYFALLTQAALSADAADADALPPGVLAKVRLNEDDALLPDLAALEERIVEAMAA